jgi:hypothetical protein
VVVEVVAPAAERQKLQGEPRPNAASSLATSPMSGVRIPTMRRFALRTARVADSPLP